MLSSRLWCSFARSLIAFCQFHSFYWRRVRLTYERELPVTDLGTKGHLLSYVFVGRGSLHLSPLSTNDKRATRFEICSQAWFETPPKNLFVTDLSSPTLFYCFWILAALGDQLDHNTSSWMGEMLCTCTVPTS